MELVGFQTPWGTAWVNPRRVACVRRYRGPVKGVSVRIDLAGGEAVLVNNGPDLTVDDVARILVDPHDRATGDPLRGDR